VIYKDAQADFDEVFHVDSEVAEKSMATLDAQVDTRVKGSEEPVLVFNPEGWSRSETVRIKVQAPDAALHPLMLDGQPLLTQVVSEDAPTHSFELLAHVSEVPPLGYKVLSFAPSGDAGVAKNMKLAVLRSDESAEAIVLGNQHIAFSIDKKTGCITSLRSDGKEFLAAGACGNQLQTYHDLPKEYDAWNIDPGTLDGTMTPIEEVDSIALVDKGPVRATVKITRHWGSSKFVQEISLDAGADEVQVANDFDWHETHVLLKAAFPLAATSDKATYEIPFGSIQRTTLRTNSWEKAKFEVPAMNWADLGDSSQGVSILNDSKYGYDAVGNTLRLTLLRSPTWPDENADRGEQKFTYAIYPHAGSWKTAETVRRGYELNDRMVGQQVFAHTGALPPSHSFGSVENRNVTLTAVKKMEDGNGLVFRMYEWEGEASQVKLHVPAGATYAVESNLMEKPEGEHLPVSGDTVTVPIKPYEILTVLVGYEGK
jgi:alpha-mannosidase